MGDARNQYTLGYPTEVNAVGSLSQHRGPGEQAQLPVVNAAVRELRGMGIILAAGAVNVFARDSGYYPVDTSRSVGRVRRIRLG